jgi:nucleotide-binding universal stress UspA family protein
VPLAGFALQGVVQAQALDSYNHAVKEDLIEIERIVRDKSAKAQVTVDFVHEINSSPATAILETAQAKNCDLIVISSHGRTGIGRMILGSQTQQVLANSTVPVLVVR